MQARFVLSGKTIEVLIDPAGRIHGVGQTIADTRTGKIITGEEESTLALLRIPESGNPPLMAYFILRQPERPVPYPCHNRISPRANKIGKLLACQRNQFICRKPRDLRRPRTPKITGNRYTALWCTARKHGRTELCTAQATAFILRHQKAKPIERMPNLLAAIPQKYDSKRWC